MIKLHDLVFYIPKLHIIMLINHFETDLGRGKSLDLLYQYRYLLSPISAIQCSLDLDMNNVRQLYCTVCNVYLINETNHCQVIALDFNPPCPEKSLSKGS